MITGNKDTDTLLFEKLEDRYLLKILDTKLIKNKEFWRRRCIQKFRINSEDYRYVKRVFEFKKWLEYNNVVYKGPFFQKISMYMTNYSHSLNCEGCPECLFSPNELGLTFMGYCRHKGFSDTELKKHFNLRYSENANRNDCINKFFRYQKEEIINLLNL